MPGNIALEKRDKVAIVSINRPEVLNACNEECVRELDNLLDSLGADKQTAVVVITGAGKSFCVGIDLKEAVGFDSNKAKAFSSLLHKLCLKIENLSKPVIAAINGYALGLGLELAMACDIRVASSDAKLGQPEVKVGIIPGAGGTQRLPLLVGKTKAKEIIFSGEMVDADEAYRIGLINKVVESERLMEETLRLAEKITENSSSAIKLSKLLINRSFDASGYELERDYFASCFGTKDQKEGMTAFFEKRKPKFD